MRTLCISALTAALLCSTSFAQLSRIANPGFEEGPAGWEVPRDPAHATIADGVAHTGARSLELRTAGKDTVAGQTFRDPGQRPMVLGGYVRADGVVMDTTKKGDQEEYARLYVHVLYKDLP
jgi:hypothetical protein